jgi:mRNA-degrading endonuclease YafQ of YafQ-DinJ toxin-antitoxin module
MNRKINIENYEAYLLDYIEGNLNSNQEEELLEFLNKHPELGKDIVDPDSYIIVPPKTDYNKTESLKKANNHSYLMISHVEKSLTALEQKELDSLLSDDTMKNELEMYHRCKLNPDKTIKYHNKDKLKKALPFTVNKVAVSIAAAIALVIISGFAINMLLQTPAKINQKGLALFTLVDFDKTTDRISKEINKNQNRIELANTDEKDNHNKSIDQRSNNPENTFTPVVLAPMSKMRAKQIEINTNIAQLNYREMPDLYEYHTITVTYKKGNEKEEKGLKDYFNKIKDIPGPVKLLKSQKEELLSYKN